MIEKLNQQIEDYRDRISKQDNEMNSLLVNLENQKQLSSKSPSAAIKSMVDKLKQQLAEKEEQQQILNKPGNNIFLSKYVDLSYLRTL